MQLPWRSLPGPTGSCSAALRLPSALAAFCAAAVTGLVAWWSIRLFAHGTLLDMVSNLGGLSATGLRTGRWWEPVTHLLVPTNTLWLLCVHLPILVLAGRHLERIIGRRHMLGLLLLTGTVGGVAQAAYDTFLLGRPDIILAGLTAPTVGVFTALAGIVPQLELVPPLKLSTGSYGPAWLRIKHGAVATLVLFGAALLLRPSGHFATHEAVRGLVAALTGCLFVRQLGFGRRRVVAVEDPEKAAEFAAAEVVAQAVSTWSGDELHPTAVAAPVAAAAGALVVPKFTERERRMSGREYVAELVDPILDKISRHGLGSLTDQERRILSKAREKLAAAYKTGA